jgi:hypothetical protein
MHKAAFTTFQKVPLASLHDLDMILCNSEPHLDLADDSMACCWQEIFHTRDEML